MTYDGIPNIIMERDNYNNVYNQWVKECEFMSSISLMMENKNFFILTQYAFDNLFYLIDRLKGSPGVEIFPLLRIVFGVNPVQYENRGNIKKMRNDWISWYECVGKYRIKSMKYIRILYLDNLPDFISPQQLNKTENSRIFYSSNYKEIDKYSSLSYSRILRIVDKQVHYHGCVYYDNAPNLDLNIYGSFTTAVDKSVNGTIYMFKLYGTTFVEFRLLIESGDVKLIKRTL